MVVRWAHGAYRVRDTRRSVPLQEILPMPTNADSVRSLYEAFARGDAAAVLAGFSPDIVWNEAEHFSLADRNPYHGPQAVAEGVLGRLMTEWDGFTVSPKRFHDAGRTVVVEGRYTGTFKATGRPLDAQFVHVWDLEDGKVVRLQQYADTAQAVSVTTGA